MTLLEYARDLKERAEARSQDVRAQENYARHQESRTAFERALLSVQEVEKLSKAVQDAGIAVLTTDEDQTWAKDIAAKVQEALETAAGHDLDRLAREAESAGAVLLTNAERRFEVALERWAERQPVPSDHVVDLLGKIAPDVADETRHAAERFRRLLGASPKDSDGISELAAAARDLADAYARLAASAPDAVGAFLEQAAVGVPLSDVEQSVIDWLRDKGVASSFVLGMRR